MHKFSKREKEGLIRNYTIVLLCVSLKIAFLYGLICHFRTSYSSTGSKVCSRSMLYCFKICHGFSLCPQLNFGQNSKSERSNRRKRNHKDPYLKVNRKLWNFALDWLLSFFFRLSEWVELFGNNTTYAIITVFENRIKSLISQFCEIIRVLFTKWVDFSTFRNWVDLLPQG